MYTYIYIYIYMYIYIYIHIHIVFSRHNIGEPQRSDYPKPGELCSGLRVRVRFVGLRVYVCTHINQQIYIYIYIHTYVILYVCICIYIYIYIHIYYAILYMSLSLSIYIYIYVLHMYTVLHMFLVASEKARLLVNLALN